MPNSWRLNERIVLLSANGNERCDERRPINITGNLVDIRSSVAYWYIAGFFKNAAHNADTDSHTEVCDTARQRAITIRII